MTPFSTSYLFAALSLCAAGAVAALQPGDIAIVSYIADNPDEVQFVALTDIADGEEIKFTDHGWKADDTFRATEGTLLWKSDGVSAGTVVSLTNDGGWTATSGSISGGSFFLSASGDQVHAYQGAEASPTFLFALNSEGSAGEWQSDSTSSNTSSEPDCVGCTVALAEVDNAHYTGEVAGTKEELLVAITDKSNWSGSNTRPSSGYSVGPFIITSGVPFITEIHYDNVGSDVDEFVEITGPTGTSLAGWSVVLYNGSSSQRKPYKSIALTGTFPNQSGGLGALAFAATGMQNGAPDAICLVDSTGTAVEFIGYEGSFTAIEEGACGGMTSTDIGVAETSQTPVEQSLQLIDGAWTGPLPNSKGTVNEALTTPPTEPVIELKFIHEIQGESDVSPLEGQVVKVKAIVTGDFQDGDADSTKNLGGFFLQEEDADADDDALTSEGIFVFDGSGSVDVNLGDLVEVIGEVEEFFGQTQIAASSVLVLSSNNNLPSYTDIELSAVQVSITDGNGDFAPDLEAYEGMLVNFPETLLIAEQFQLDRFNEIKLVAGDRPFQFTQFNTPDAAGYAAYTEALGRRRITYDDGLNTQNNNVGLLEGFGPYNTATAPRMGDAITDLNGVLSWSWAGSRSSGNTWRVRGNGDAPLNTFVNANPRPDSPANPSSNFMKITTLNVLNFFTTLRGQGSSGPNNSSPRGASNQAEFDRQLEKLVTAILEMDADVYGLVELENEFGDQNGDGKFAVGTLIDALNERLGQVMYDFVDPGTPYVGGDAIACGYIYKPSVVNLDGAMAVLDSSVDPRFIDTKNRPALAQTFHPKSNPKACVTLSINHFKSKGSACDDVGDIAPSPSNGAGNCNGVRNAAAAALADWLDTKPTGTECETYAIHGDLNSYAKEQPIQTLIEQGFVNTEKETEYSYVFDGQIGTLDYFLLKNDDARFISSTVWHINEDEADALDYNLDFGRPSDYFDGQSPARNSDHSPIVSYFDTTIRCNENVKMPCKNLCPKIEDRDCIANVSSNLRGACNGLLTAAQNNGCLDAPVVSRGNADIFDGGN